MNYTEWSSPNFCKKQFDEVRILNGGVYPKQMHQTFAAVYEAFSCTSTTNTQELEERMRSDAELATSVAIHFRDKFRQLREADEHYPSSECAVQNVIKDVFHMRPNHAIDCDPRAASSRLELHEIVGDDTVFG